MSRRGDFQGPVRQPERLFRNAGCRILSGSFSGPVGPGGAGKTGIFRLVRGEETVDGSELTKPRQGLGSDCSQDLGTLTGRSALAEVSTFGIADAPERPSNRAVRDIFAPNPHLDET